MGHPNLILSRPASPDGQLRPTTRQVDRRDERATVAPRAPTSDLAELLGEHPLEPSTRRWGPAGLSLFVLIVLAIGAAAVVGAVLGVTLGELVARGADLVAGLNGWGTG